MTLTARFGAICYLDEIVEARNDTAVNIHSLTDDRRLLYVDKTREVIRTHDCFMLIMSGLSACDERSEEEHQTALHVAGIQSH